MRGDGVKWRLEGYDRTEMYPHTFKNPELGLGTKGSALGLLTCGIFYHIFLQQEQIH